MLTTMHGRQTLLESSPYKVAHATPQLALLHVCVDRLVLLTCRSLKERSFSA